MKKMFRHKKTVLTIGLVVLVFLGFIGWQRSHTVSHSVYDTLEDVERGEPIETNDFYSLQLTQKEYEDFLFLKEKLDCFEGGVLTFPHPLSGKEYQRVITALEYDGYNYFYGFADVPMTEDGVYVLKKERDIFRITEEKISKVVLFLSCAEGITLSGQFADDGTLINLEEIQKGLSVNQEDKIKEIRDTQEETETALAEILEGIPKDSGEKTTAAYLLKWLDENVKLADDANTTAQKLSNMGDMLEQVYPYNHLAALKDRKASVLGKAKIFSELCRRAGIDSHVVMGTWNSQWTDGETYVLCQTVIDGQKIYVDASGAKASALAGSRYLTEKEATSRMTFVDYFEYK